MSSISKQTANLDATALAELVKRKEVSAAELVDAAIARLEAVNADLNAVITPMYESAREQAAGSAATGPFAGVPFLVKDFLAEVEGVRFTEGSHFLGEYVPAADSGIIRRFRDAGLVFIGKTNTPELAIGATTEPQRFGPTHNPWDLSRTPGGSSGGSGATWPRRWPSRARVSLGPLYGDLFGGIVAELGLTRSVRDTARLLDAVAGPMTGEPYIAAPAPDSYENLILRPPRPLKVGFSTVTPLGDPLDPECEQAVRDAAALCAELGHHVEEQAPDYDALNLWSHLTTMLASGIAWAQADWSRRLDKPLDPRQFEPFVWAFGDRGRALSAPDYLMAVQDLQAEVRRFSGFFESYDLWLTPTLGQPPVPLGTLSYDGDPIELRRRTAKFSPFTYIGNATGQPGISLPLHWTADDLPVGVHFLARLGEEHILLALAAQLEQAKPWHDRLPAIIS